VLFFFTLFGISSAWTFYGYPGFLYRHGRLCLFCMGIVSPDCLALYVFRSTFYGRWQNSITSFLPVEILLNDMNQNPYESPLHCPYRFYHPLRRDFEALGSWIGV